MAIQKKYENHPQVGATFDWPDAPTRTDRPAESYSDEVWHALVLAAIKDVKSTMRLMNTYQSIVDEEDQVLPPELSLENLMYDLVTDELAHQQAGLTTPFETIIRQRSAVKAYLRQSGLTPTQFIELFRREGKLLAAKGRGVDPHTMSLNSGWCFKGCVKEKTNRMLIAHCARALPRWPLYCSWEEIRSVYSGWSVKKMDRGDGSFETRMKMYTSRCFFGDEAKPIETGLSAHVAYQFFTGHTLFPFILYVQIVTGWNLKVIGQITANLAEHLGSPLVDDGDTIMIYSIKKKNATNLSDGRVIFHASSRNKPLSAYNVLRFIADQIERISGSPYYRPDSIWQFMNVGNGPDSRNSPMEIMIGDNETMRSGYGHYSQAFCARHDIVTDPELVRQTIDSKRLRTTWETKQSQVGRLMEQISQQMGHADLDTTANSYHNDGGSNSVDNKNLRALLNQHVDDFTNYGPRLVASVTLQDLRKALDSVNTSRKLDLDQKTRAAKVGLESEDEIVHLLSPSGHTYIAACKNSRKPTWPDSDHYVLEGSRCRFFNKCCLCKQGMIFKEALPYVARRILDLDRLRVKTHPIEWMRDYSKEHEGWSEILRRWSNQFEVEEAMGMAERNEVILPLTMRGA
jgi:hypothetical protein